MGNIYNHLDMIKKRPGMYIGGNELTILFYYLLGYKLCLHEKNIEEFENPPFHYFNEWVRKYYGYNEATSGWLNMIIDKTKNEKEALDLFFILLERFKKEEKIDFVDKLKSFLKDKEGTQGMFYYILGEYYSDIDINSDNWARIIYNNTKDEKEALDTFYMLYGKSRKLYNKVGFEFGDSYSTADYKFKEYMEKDNKNYKN